MGVNLKEIPYETDTSRAGKAIESRLSYPPLRNTQESAFSPFQRHLTPNP